MTITMKAEPMAIEVDALALTEDLARTLGSYYAKQLEQGRRPEGGALPLNKKGQPIGRGSGTISDNWVTGTAHGSKSSASSSTSPWQEGGYFYAVRSMTEKGASPVSVEGRAGELISAVIARHADRMVK